MAKEEPNAEDIAEVNAECSKSSVISPVRWRPWWSTKNESMGPSRQRMGRERRLGPPLLVGYPAGFPAQKFENNSN